MYMNLPEQVFFFLKLLGVKVISKILNQIAKSKKLINVQILYVTITFCCRANNIKSTGEIELTRVQAIDTRTPHEHVLVQHSARTIWQTQQHWHLECHDVSNLTSW